MPRYDTRECFPRGDPGRKYDAYECLVCSQKRFLSPFSAFKYTLNISHCVVWLCARGVRELGHRLRVSCYGVGLATRLPALRVRATTLGKLFTRMSLCHQAV